MPRAVTIVPVAGYLLGSIPVADLVTGRRATIDLRTVGDRNPGYWNAKEQLGPRAALPIFVGDIAKGAAAAALGAAVAGSGAWWLAYVGGGAAMVGHAWPLFAGFRGGRSVLTFVGAGLVCAPRPGAVAIATAGAVWAVGRSFAQAARVGVAAFPVAQLALEGRHRTAATGALMTFVGLRFALATTAARSAGAGERSPE